MNSSASSAVRDFEKLFLKHQCAEPHCYRRPAQGSQFCGCHREDRRAGRVTVFTGVEELSAIGERATARAAAVPYLGGKERLHVQ